MKQAKKKPSAECDGKRVALTIQDQEFTPLTPDERAELDVHISEIRLGFQTFFRVAHSLSCIWRQKLYRESHRTFEAFCKDVLEISKGHAYRLLDAAEVHECLSKIEGVVLPQSEAHLRPLAAVPRTKVAKVWKTFIEQRNGKKITAQEIENFVSEFNTGKKKVADREQWKERVLGSLKRIRKALQGDDVDEILMEIERMKLNVEQIGGMGRGFKNRITEADDSKVGI